MLYNAFQRGVLFCSLAFLDPRVGHTMDVLSPLLTGNHSDSVPATLTLASCFLYSLASKSIKCRGYPISIIVIQSLLFVIIELLSLARTVETLQAEIWQRWVGHFDRPFWVERDVAHQPLLGSRKLEGLPFHVV